MGCTRTFNPRTAAAGRWPRSTVEAGTGRTQRHSLDTAHRRTLEGYAPPIPTIPNLPSALPTVGSGGGHGPNSCGLGRRPQRARRPGPQRMFYRRHLRGCQKRGAGVGKTKRGKGTKVMAVADRAGFPLAVCVTSASPHEVTLVETTLDHCFVDDLPQKLIGDRAYDSDPLDISLATQGVEMIAPHRRSRKKPKTQDGRKLRRYKRRWKVERLFAWLGNFRRLVVRYEHKIENFLAFVKLGCIIILLRKYL